MRFTTVSGVSRRSLQRRASGPSRSSCGPRDTVRCPRGEGLSQPLFMKVTTPPRSRLVIRRAWTVITREPWGHLC